MKGEAELFSYHYCVWRVAEQSVNAELFETAQVVTELFLVRHKSRRSYYELVRKPQDIAVYELYRSDDVFASVRRGSYLSDSPAPRPQRQPAARQRSRFPGNDRHKIGHCSVRRVFLYDELAEFSDDLAAQFVESARGNDESLTDIRSDFTESEYRVTEPSELLSEHFDICRSIFRSLGDIALHFCRNITAYRGHRNRLAALYHDSEIHRVNRALKAVKLVYFRDKVVSGSDIVLFANAEHIPSFSREIAVRKAAAGKYRL